MPETPNIQQNDIAAAGNEIVVYQPDQTMRIEVRLADESVWLSQTKLGILFQVDRTVVSRHIHNIYKTGELEEAATCAKIAQVQIEGSRTVTRSIPFYNLDVIIAVGYRVNSLAATLFRKWATSILKDYLLRGYAFNQRIAALEDRTDRRIAAHDTRISTLERKVDFFVQTQTPPLKGVFYDGQLWDARTFVEKLVKSAKKSLVVIDNWATVETLDMLAAKKAGVFVRVATSEHHDRKGNPRPKILPADIAKFNAQYPSLTVSFSEKFHDRFIIIDDADLYLIGASLKDLGKKCFGFTKMDASEITAILARI